MEGFGQRPPKFISCIYHSYYNLGFTFIQNYGGGIYEHVSGELQGTWPLTL